MNYCRQMKGCPASQYFICPAYLKDDNCWENENIPCCRRKNKKRCDTCSMYIAFTEGKIEQIYPMTVEIN